MVGPVLARKRPFTRNPATDPATNADDDVNRHDVLILFADPLGAALLGAAVEIAGHVPHFPQPGEGARAALLRLRPRAVLVDCDHEEASTDAFIGPALMTGARVQLLCSRRTRRDMSIPAQRLGLSIAELPMEHDQLVALLRDLPATTT